MQETSVVLASRSKETTKKEEKTRATKLLKGKVIKSVKRHWQEEVIVIFEDGQHFFLIA